MNSMLAGMPRGMPFHLPEGYFEALPEQSIAVCKQEGAAVPFIESKAFAVPEGYFEQLPVQLLKAAKKRDAVKRLIALPAMLSSGLKWAAAAVLVACVGVGVYRATIQSGYERELSRVPEGAISAYVQQHMDASELSDPGEIPNPMLKELRSEEIIQYLDETGWD